VKMWSFDLLNGSQVTYQYVKISFSRNLVQNIERGQGFVDTGRIPE